MHHRAFDVVARRAARALDRRSLLGLLTGTLLAGALQPVAAGLGGGSDHKGGGGGNGGGDKGGGRERQKKRRQDRKDKNFCKKNAQVCRNTVIVYCATSPEWGGTDPVNFALCYNFYDSQCCVPLGQCKPAGYVCI